MPRRRLDEQEVERLADRRARHFACEHRLEQLEAAAPGELLGLQHAAGAGALAQRGFARLPGGEGGLRIALHFDSLVSTTIAATIVGMSAAVKPEGCTNLKLRQLMRTVARHYDAHVAPTGLKGTQYSLLSYIVRLGPVRPTDLAHAMRLDASTLTRNLQPLVAAGWVTLGPGDDARSRHVEATEAGRAKRTEGQRAWKQAQLALNARLGEARVVRLHALLDECVEVLDAAEEDTDE